MTMGANQQVDLKKSFGVLYKPRNTDCTLVTPPPLTVLVVEGAGDPGTAASWSDAVGALYGVAYTLKFMLKKSGAAPDFIVMPLEALWWVAEGESFSLADKSNWLWRAMIVLPDFITQAHMDEALPLARKKKANESLDLIARASFAEGPSAQVLHVGPYADEPPTVARLQAFIAEQGFVQVGKHHEIYLSDPQRTAPEKMKTIIRLPIRPATDNVVSHF